MNERSDGVDGALANAASRFLERFELTSIRLHLFSGDVDAAGEPAAVASRDPRQFAGGLERDALLAAMRAPGPVCEALPTTRGDGRFRSLTASSAYLGLTIPGAAGPVGFAECYRKSPFPLGLTMVAEQAMSELGAAIEAARRAAVAAPASRGTILVADDDPSVRMLVRRLLGNAGYAVIDVENGALAVQEARRHAPDLIVIDWMMPVLDGRSATLQLKADPLTRKIPVLMLTLQGEIDEKVSALRAGVQDFVTKPFDGRELLARVEQHVQWRHVLVDDEPGTESVAAGRRVETRSVERGSDSTTRAREALQLGRPREALALYLADGRTADEAGDVGAAAVAYRNASLVAGDLMDANQAAMLLRLAGNRYSVWFEANGAAMQADALYATRVFVKTGELRIPDGAAERTTLTGL